MIYRDPKNIKRVVVHCTATSPSEDIGGQEVGELHAIRGISANPHGYNALILRNGMVEDGRPIDAVPAGAKGFNTDGLHIALVGGLKEDGLTLTERYRQKQWGTPEANFTRSQYQALESWLDSVFKEWPHLLLDGHGDLPGVNKACPCFNVKAWYGVPEVG